MNEWQGKGTGFETEATRKPRGGFCFISARALLSAWAAYGRRDLRLFDLRVWFGCFELVARRCCAKKGIHPKYTIEELHKLVGGVGGEHIRRSITRLERVGLLRWQPSSIVLSKMNAISIDSHLGRMLELVSNHNRPVPVPREIIKLIASGARRVLIATIIGHLLRCLYYRSGKCFPDGTCKASWIAEVFVVDVRNVKTARKHLVTMGWLLPVVRGQTYLNRFGKRIRVNLEWSRSVISRAMERSPQKLISTTELPPPYKDKKLLRRSENQKPESGPSGVKKQPKREGKPNLWHVVADDLSNPWRLNELHRQALGIGLIGQSDCDRLRFFAAAEHARAIGTHNPCGLFVTVVRRELWAYVTQDDEDAAQRRLRELDLDTYDQAKHQTTGFRQEPKVPPGKSTIPRSAIRALIEESLGLESGRIQDAA